MSGLRQIFDDPGQSMNLALGLGALGGIVLGIAVGIESIPLLVAGIAVLAGSGVVWTVRGVREDRVTDE